jgi:hypothetical protein
MKLEMRSMRICRFPQYHMISTLYIIPKDRFIQRYLSELTLHAAVRMAAKCSNLYGLTAALSSAVWSPFFVCSVCSDQGAEVPAGLILINGLNSRACTRSIWFAKPKAAPTEIQTSRPDNSLGNGSCSSRLGHDKPSCRYLSVSGVSPSGVRWSPSLPKTLADVSEFLTSPPQIPSVKT